MRISADKWMAQLIDTEDQQVKRLNEIVTQSLKEEKLLTHKLRHESIDKRNIGERVADKAAQLGGSWAFILAFLLFFGIWIAINLSAFFGANFDPYPFILLNLILSLVAALQAPMIMMSQNRQEAKDRRRSEHDYLINLKAEIEIRALHQKMDMFLLEQFKTLLNSQQRQLEILEILVNKREG